MLWGCFRFQSYWRARCIVAQSQEISPRPRGEPRPWEVQFAAAPHVDEGERRRSIPAPHPPMTPADERRAGEGATGGVSVRIRLDRRLGRATERLGGPGRNETRPAGEARVK
jgi:hypothetical protein